MRKSDLKKNHVAFDDALARYRSFLTRVIDAKHIIRTAQEKRDVAESVLLRLCAHWERFIDEHLVDCVNKDHSRLSEHFSVAIPPHPTWDLCHALVIGTGYVDFKGFGDLKKQSKQLLPDVSNPFLAVSKAHADRIDELFRIRNYLSHYSSAARRSLFNMYKQKYKLKRFVEPGQFVLSKNGDRLWSYFDAFEGASNDMKNWY